MRSLRVTSPAAAELRGILIALEAALILFAAAPAAAQHPTDRNCSGDRGTYRCAQAQQRRIRELYGVQSIDQHQATGDQVRRIFYVDGYGSDLLLISFVRAPGSDPTVWVHFPRREGEAAVEALHASVPQAVWEDVLFRSSHFDRELVPLPPDRASRSICFHSWTYTIEATDPAPSRDEPSTLRRTVEGACEQGLAQRYAIDIERAALPLFPHCARLASNQHRNPSTQLAACRILRGDRVAAAEVRNLAGAFQAISGPWDAARLGQVLTDRSVIDWNGERNEGPDSAAPFWVAHVAPSMGVANIYFQSIEGESVGRVRLIGTLIRTRATPQGRAAGTETARVEQLWTRHLGRFQVEVATIGPWEPYPPTRPIPTETNRGPRPRSP